MVTNNIIPILKWAGGKRQLLKSIIPRIPEEYDNYYEPFLGGASVFFALKPKNAIVNDLNIELINVYLTVKNHPNELIEILKIHKKSHSKDYYYTIRAMDRDKNYNNLSNVEKAARIIYLNHTCYNGLYRVNKKGYFNTPIGKYKNPKILNEDNIINVSRYFNKYNIKFVSGDYNDVLKKVKEGDFVYLDPPYDPISYSSSFTMYTNVGFSKDEQIKLKETCDRLNAIGAKFLESNSDTPFIRELYKDYKIETISVCRMINAQSNNRKGINEVLISNY